MYLKKILIVFICLIVGGSVTIPGVVFGQGNSSMSFLNGKFLLQVDDGGRIWYIPPGKSQRYELKNSNKRHFFSKVSLGITNENFMKIPLAKEAASDAKDDDGDGWSDFAELESGHNPFGPGKANYNKQFAQRLKGRILLQVQDKGRLWYVDQNGEKWEIEWHGLHPFLQKHSVGVLTTHLNAFEPVILADDSGVKSPSSKDSKNLVFLRLNDELNEFRATHQKAELQSHLRLCNLAQERVKELYNDYYHEGLTERVASGQLKDLGYTEITESTWRGESFKRPENIINELGMSEFHRRNLLNDWGFSCGYYGHGYAVIIFMNR